MLYTELLQLWDQAVQAVDGRDWQGALTKLQEITEPTSRTLFVTAATYLALGQLEPAIRTLDQVIAKDERLAVGFFQRAGVHMLAGRLEEALGDCIWAQKHMRENSVIDYRQLGLRYKLYSWQVLYNAAAVYSRMGLWEKGRNILATASQEKGGARGGIVEMALDSLSRKDILSPLLVPEGEVFRPKKQDVEQLQLRDFLGKAKVISSVIPNDDFGGFEPLRMQQPGFYEPQADGAQESRYMRLRSAYTAQGPQQLTVREGEVVFVFSNERADGLATVIYDGQKGLLPFSLLDPLDIYKIKGKKKGKIPNGIPLPPGLKPPARPLPQPSPASAQSVTLPAASDPSGTDSAFSSVTPPEYPSAAGSGDELQPSPAPEGEGGSVTVKVHYTCTVALSVPAGTPYSVLRERIAHKLGRPGERLCLRYKQQGSPALKALEEQGELHSLLQGSETGRVTLWCQSEDPLSNRNILYQVMALYDYTAQGPEDLEFSEGDTIDILSEGFEAEDHGEYKAVNDEWLEGHTAGNIGIFPRCFVYQDTPKSDDSA